MGRRSRRRERDQSLQVDLLGESRANTAGDVVPPVLAILTEPAEAPTLQTSSTHDAPLAMAAPVVGTTATAASPPVPVVTVEVVTTGRADASSTVQSGGVGAAPPSSSPLGTPPAVEPPVLAPVLQIVSVETADRAPAPAVAPSPVPPPSAVEKHPASALTLEPPPGRPAQRGGRRGPGKGEARATRARRPEPVDGDYAAHAPAAPSEEDPGPSGRGKDGLAREAEAPRARPAGEPLARARALVEQRKIQEAIELYLGILTVNPSNLKARNNLGVLFDELKQFDAARDHLEAAARLEPENVEVLANLASTLTSLSRYDEAEAILRRAQKVDVDDPRVRTSIAILYFRRGLYEQAETELRSVCARDRDNGAAFYYRGEALDRLGRYDEAIEALRRAAELLPNDPKPVYTLGHIYDRKHLPDEAAEMYRRARRLQKR